MVAMMMSEQFRHRLTSCILMVILTVLPMCITLLATTAFIRFVVDEELCLVQGMQTTSLPYFYAITGLYVYSIVIIE